MKHKSFYEEYLKIQSKEIEELRKCLKKYGNSFDWEESNVECPIVTAGIKVCEYVGDVYVKKIRIEDNGHIAIVVDLIDDSVCDLEIGVDDIHFSHLDFIMSYLPSV